MLVLCNKCCHQRKKYQDLSSSLIPLLYPMVAGVTKPLYTRSSASTAYAYTIGILERLILHLHGYLITGSSGTAVGGKGLNKRSCASNLKFEFNFQIAHYSVHRVIMVHNVNIKIKELVLQFNFEHYHSLIKHYLQLLFHLLMIVINELFIHFYTLVIYQ